MATVAVQPIDDDLAAVYSAASPGGDKFSPAAGTFLHVKNGSGAAVTVTLVTAATADGLAVADQTTSVPAGAERFIKPPADRLLKDADDLAAITWSATTTVTFAVLNV